MGLSVRLLCYFIICMRNLCWISCSARKSWMTKKEACDIVQLFLPSDRDSIRQKLKRHIKDDIVQASTGKRKLDSEECSSSSSSESEASSSSEVKKELKD